jgi:hypothetical protein
MSETDRPASHDVGRRIIREAMPAERERHTLIRAAVEDERPEIIAWARRETAHAEGDVAVGLVLGPEESPVLDAIDAYAASHNLPGRSAVVREALARLLDIRLDSGPKRSA